MFNKIVASECNSHPIGLLDSALKTGQTPKKKKGWNTDLKIKGNFTDCEETFMYIYIIM